MSMSATRQSLRTSVQLTVSPAGLACPFSGRACLPGFSGPADACPGFSSRGVWPRLPGLWVCRLLLLRAALLLAHAGHPFFSTYQAGRARS